MTEIPPVGSPAELRGFISEVLRGAYVHTCHAIDYAELGQDELLCLSLRNATSCFRAALATYGELRSKSGQEEPA